ncbi:hypothetical protein [Micromonospora avicenniae]|uniref:Uncharacterized protein n=1 Tax=Micromonospora avicenniae TaxID=1198245 RepID=A0A1N6VU79_9ACTN|nr:hypothetical protein [Micromonospora avicenniae]SIQ81338.1 hypothetical protein SAMN05444858_104249 [Micromonospora avicenniae]
MSVTAEARRAGRSPVLLIGVAGGWLSLLVCNYLAYPLLDVLSLLALPVLAGCWLLAVSTSVAALVVLLVRRAYVWAAGALALAIGSGLILQTTDWERAYVDSQFRLHRSQLAELAAGYRVGEPPPDVALPWRLRYLSIDGQAHERDGALYLPVWQDWRAESGVGLAYFPTSPTPDAVIATASGDKGKPVRYLGDGWWWIA